MTYSNASRTTAGRRARRVLAAHGAVSRPGRPWRWRPAAASGLGADLGGRGDRDRRARRRHGREAGRADLRRRRRRASASRPPVRLDAATAGNKRPSAAAASSSSSGRRRGWPRTGGRRRPRRPTMTSAAGRIGAGLAPSRPARPIRAGGADPRRRRGGRRRERGRPPGRAGGRDRRPPAMPAALAVHAGTRRARDPRSRRSTPPTHVTTHAAARTVSRSPRPSPRSTPTPRSSWRRGPPASRSSPGSRSSPTRPPAATLVGVAGTHGKSTTAGLARPRPRGRRRATRRPSSARSCRPRSPAAPPATARSGAGPAFVVEADEYAGNFDAYHPDVAVLTSAEWDHPDVFADAAAVAATFETLGAAAPAMHARRERRRRGRRRASPNALADWSGSIVAYALVDQAPQRLGGVRPGDRRALRDRRRTGHGRCSAGSPPRTRPATTLEIHGLDPLAGAVTARLATAGRHNAANALAVAGAAAAPRRRPGRRSRRVSRSFRGVGRRLERKGEAAGVVVYDDYGHHPTAIRATLEAVRQREPGRPRLGRLRAADVPSDGRDARRVRGRRSPRPTPWPSPTSGPAATRTRRSPRRRPWPRPSRRGRPASRSSRRARSRRPPTRLPAPCRPGDVVLVMGGGHSYRIGRRLLHRLEATMMVDYAAAGDLLEA